MYRIALHTYFIYILQILYIFYIWCTYFIDIADFVVDLIYACCYVIHINGNQRNKVLRFKILTTKAATHVTTSAYNTHLKRSSDNWPFTTHLGFVRSSPLLSKLDYYTKNAKQLLFPQSSLRIHKCNAFTTTLWIYINTFVDRGIYNMKVTVKLIL